MANEEHLNFLKQGVKTWNQWRKEKPDIIQPDLSKVNLSKADLSEAHLHKTDLHDANLTEAHLHKADLRDANLIEAYLFRANLFGANLSGADLNGAHLNGADLSGADLNGADLNGADLSEAYLNVTNLTGADLSKADLTGADLSGANLSGTNFRKASVGWTIFGDIDLSVVKELNTVEHRGPSTLGIDTIYRSDGNIPEAFLRGAGVPDTFITCIASLTGQAIQYYSCFISYSSKDEEFAQRLHADLQSKDVSCWYAPEDLIIGAKIRPTIDETIQVHDKLLLVLSKHSVKSQWVEQEVETALEKERKRGETVLFPIRLDNVVMKVERGWPALIKNTRNIGNFSSWKDHDAYQKSFNRLLQDLKAERTKK